MSKRKSFSQARNRLSAALIAAMILPATGAAFAQDASTTDGTQQPATQDSKDAKTLDKIVVTGSLIPRSQLETATPVTTITAEDIQARGFVSVSDALQKSTMATGGVQGAKSSASFTQGAETLSLFGLSPSYVKYLIDGRPMADYPALYNGSDTFNNISGIPIDMVERIEILPGGQSSLYGSDAIAGVINIILKKRYDGTTLNVRGGGYSEGGGNNFRASLGTGFSSADERFNTLLGVQYEERDPIWNYQRDLTKQFNQHGYSAPTASRDYLVYGYQDIANQGFYYFHYAFPDGADNCSRITGQFGGTEGKQFRNTATGGDYCGSFYTPGYATMANGKKSGQIYSHNTFDINDHTQLYADVLLNEEKTSYNVGSNYTWWGTGTRWGYYYDPDLDGLVNLQRAFAPEDMGREGFNNSMSTDTSKSYSITAGVSGTFGGSDWDYDIGYTRTQYKLDEKSWVRFADAIDGYFQEHVLGPQLGWDPYFGAYPVFQPDYAAFYTPMTQADFESFSGFAHSHSKTTSDLLRAQVTNSNLFALPGGNAGLAIVAEAGKQDWRYDPDPGFMNGEIWGQTAVAGDGQRDRYAVTSELRMPVLKTLTLNLSGRYDNFRTDDGTLDKATYSLGVEFRPTEKLLFRGKYGTAFKAPTLSDLYQGLSGYYSFVTDYYQCSLAGHGPDDIDNCPTNYSNRQYFGQVSGNPELRPINADVWSAGAVWSPFDRSSISVDYLHWKIDDEVTSQSADALTLQEYRCRTGIDDINSALCTQTLSQITRANGGVGNITQIYTPKINVSRETLDAVTLAANYATPETKWGTFSFRGSFTENLKHEYQQYAGDDVIDLLTNPYWSSDPKRKADLSMGWDKGSYNAVLYANWFSETPNYAATITDAGYAGARAGKLPSHITWNLSLGYQPIPQIELSLMVNNLFNKMPPLDKSYPGTSSAPYNGYNFDVYGRAIYVEARYKFGAK